MSCKRTFVSLFALASAVAASQGCAVQPDTQGDDPAAGGTQEQPSVIGDPSTYFGHSILSVCWGNASTANAAARTAVQKAVTNEYHKKSRVRLADFTPCAIAGDSGGSGRVAVYLVPNGSPDLYQGSRSLSRGHLGGKIILNQDTDVATVAVHEFGHQVGLYHEQDRGDSPCRSEPGNDIYSDSIGAIGPYDPRSVMNYCAWNGKLTLGDQLALKALYGSPGSFVQEGNAIYRYHNGEKCHVVNPDQLNAFGGSSLVDQGIIEPEAMSGWVNVGECRWPDGFYQPAGTNKAIYAIGGEDPASKPMGGSGAVPPGSLAAACWIENPSQLDVYAGSGRVMPVSAGIAEVFRLRRGTAGTRCVYPDGFYQLGGEPPVYQVTGNTYCHVPNEDAMILSGGFGLVHHVSIDSTVLSSRTSAGTCDLVGFYPLNRFVDKFAGYASTPGAQIVTGDFDGDGATDVALAGVSGWTTVPVAFSRRDGTFFVTNTGLADFPGWAASSGAKLVAGDFNGDGAADLALVGGPGWTTLPVAFSARNGAFTVKNRPLALFPGWAQSSARPIVGDFNGDGADDIALVGGPGWTTIPIAFSNRDGTFRVVNKPVADFPGWAQNPAAKIVAADLDNDGDTDIAMVGVPGWKTIPTAFSNRDGTFTVKNEHLDQFADWAAADGVQAVAGRFRAGAPRGIALAGGPGWVSAPIAHSNTNGTYWQENKSVSSFPLWARTPGAKLVAGDFSGDGLTDLLVLGVPGWATMPLAIRK